MPSVLTSTKAIYDVLTARMLGYVPAALVLPGQSTPQPLSTLLGTRMWVEKAPDNVATSPWVVYRLMQRQTDGSTHGVLETFLLELSVWGRPRSAMQMVTAVADQIQTALVDYKEPTSPMTIRDVRLRQSFFAMTTPADVDVVREYLQFDGFAFPGYVTAETGTS
jgi:hypothetical protein